MARSDTLRLPAPSAAPSAVPRAPPSPSALAEVQTFCQAHARRGLREGAPALARARNAYLSAEWSGEHDRRPEPGLIARARA